MPKFRYQFIFCLQSVHGMLTSNQYSRTCNRENGGFAYGTVYIEGYVFSFGFLRSRSIHGEQF